MLRGTTGGGDRDARDQLERQVGAALGGDAGVEELRDVRVAEPGQDVALAAEALRDRAAGEMGVGELEGDAALVGAVAPRGEPDDPHAAASELTFEGVGTDLLTGARSGIARRRIGGVGSVGGVAGQSRERSGSELPAGASGEHPAEVGQDRGVRRRQAVEPVRARRRRHLDRPIEEAGELRPELSRAG